MAAFNFLCPDPQATVELNGTTINLYPISVKQLLKLKRVGKPIAKVVSHVFSPTQSNGQTSRTSRQGGNPEVDDDNGFFATEDVIDPISPELYKLQAERREMLIEEVVESIFHEEAFDVLIDTIADSMRDERDRIDTLRKELRGADLPAIIALAKGVAEANKEVFAPLTDLIPSDLKERVKGGVEAATQTTDSGAPSPETSSGSLSLVGNESS